MGFQGHNNILPTVYTWLRRRVTVQPVKSRMALMRFWGHYAAPGTQNPKRKAGLRWVWGTCEESCWLLWVIRPSHPEWYLYNWMFYLFICGDLTCRWQWNVQTGQDSLAQTFTIPCLIYATLAPFCNSLQCNQFVRQNVLSKCIVVPNLTN